MARINDIGRWRSEIILAEDFRDKEFGIYTNKNRTKAGENIDYFEQGFSAGFHDVNDSHFDSTTTLNLFHTVAKLVIPTLMFQNPRVLSLPKRKTDEDAAPFAREILNYFYKELEVDFENELVVWDGYVLNRGIYKVGYTTKFGMDIPDPELEKKKKKNLTDRALETLGLKKPKKEELVKPEVDQKIIAEYPYIKWVSPFRFLMDPRARTLDEAQWVAEEFDKTVSELKNNKNYKNTATLEGTEPEIPRNVDTRIPGTQLDEFKIVRVYEIHYRNANKMYRLVLAKDGEVFKELYHDVSMYEMDGFQYDLIEFNRHGHLQYKRSDLTKIKNLQDRFTSTIDSILEQLDRFVPKVAYDSNKVTQNGIKALRDGDIGAIVETNGPPSEAIQEVAFTQFKADLKAFSDEIINIVTITTGITRSKLLGLSTAETATGETIAQGGENIRTAEMSKTVHRFTKNQASKLWQVIKQFVPLEELNLITGETGIDPETGRTQYSWLDDIDSAMSQKLAEGQFRFDIEVGSTQRIDSALINKRIENLISILARPDIIALMQQQGKKIDIAEIVRIWLMNNPEIVRDSSRIIQDVTQQTQGLLPAQDILLGGGAGGTTGGSDLNAQRAQQAEAPVSQGQVLQEAGQL